ncbi:MAG: hypothetical protein ACI9BW_002970 [Gammaproteobacteria bacterium]|jgi:hypothetical protein
MTESEVIESAFMMGAGAVSVFTIYISVIFAYLAAAYFVGANLTRFQASVLTGLFIATETVSAAACTASVLGWEKLIALYPSVLNTIPFYTLGIWHKYMAGLLAVGIVVGLYFMHNIRSIKGKDNLNESAT